MFRIGFSSCLALAVSAAFLAITGCSHAPHTVAQSAPPPLLQTKEIHVNQDCRILSDRIDGVRGLDVSSPRTEPVCHLESVLNSQHLEQAVSNGLHRARLVTISEQEYLLNNTTVAPVDFLVEQPVPAGWRVDSDPHPTQMLGATALFRVTAQPGQIVRLHVGERHDSQPIAMAPILVTPPPAPQPSN
ncbi:MAG: hypothetical protein WA634_14945 [Silvibacterium sp.]